MEMISAVAELTKFNFEEIFQMPAQDFIVYIKFVNERNRREAERQRMEIAKMRAKYGR